MYIDSHQHFWHYNTHDYGWMGENMNAIKRDFLPGDLEAEMEGTGFSGSIAVQARQNSDETEWLLKLADKYDVIKGVVGWVDLQAPILDTYLDEYTKNPKFVGVRHVLHDEADDEFMLRETFLEGIAKLEQYNLTYDILIFHKHLPQTIELVKKFPNITFILDHIAKPDIKNKSIQPWKKHIEELSLYENVYCKVSGMVTENNWEKWDYKDFVPYLDAIFATFGTNRVMIGSDWPVCKVVAPYEYVLGIVAEYIKIFPDEEKDKILKRNAIKAYNLKI